MSSTVFLVGTILVISAPTTKEVPKKGADTPTIVGTWRLDKMTIAGMEMPIKDLAFEFTADGKLIRVDARGADEGKNTYKIDSTKTPGELDWLMEGKKEQTIKGIFAVDGDTLTICLEDGYKGVRPDKFESPAGSKRMLWTLRRTSK